MRVSGNALEILTKAFVRRWLKRCIRVLIWIDYLCFIIVNPHSRRSTVPAWFCPLTAPGSPAPFSDLEALFVDCGGLASCPDCQASYKKACE
eukprot:376706-Rhodomonas_salina.1